MTRLEFDAGLTCCRVPDSRSPAVHRLTCEWLAGTEGVAYWIDAGNAASTHTLYDCASSPRTLDGLRIARAFTAYQHHALVRSIAREAGGRAGSGRGTEEVALIVAPNVGDPYRDGDLAGWERERLFASTLTTLAELGRALECPVLVTTADGRDAETIDAHARATIECIPTREGLRLEGDGVETSGYWHGTYWQTTIPYWVDLCGALGASPFDPHPVVSASDDGVLEYDAGAFEVDA